MEFLGAEGVLTLYLMDLKNRLGDGRTAVSYTYRLGDLVCLLRELCSITEVEQVEVKHLRQCMQHLLTVPMGRKGRPTDNASGILAISTVKAYIRVWKAFFNWCYQEELIDVNPVSRLKFPKAPKRITPAFTNEHIEKMLTACDTSTKFGFRDYVILLLLLDTGMRLDEIANLTIDNVHEGYVKVLGKGCKEREIGIHPDMSKLLWKYVHKYRKSNESENKLFIGRKGELHTSGIYDIVRRIQVRAGLDNIKFSPHVFRHTHSKMYMENGGDLFKLSRELGHSSVQVTKIYLEDFSSVEARKDHNSYTPLSFLKLKKQARKKQKDAEK